MAVQDTPVLFAIGLLCFVLAWITRDGVASPRVTKSLHMEVRHAWISSVIVCCSILLSAMFSYHNYALSVR